MFLDINTQTYSQSDRQTDRQTDRCVCVQMRVNHVLSEDRGHDIPTVTVSVSHKSFHSLSQHCLCGVMVRLLLPQSFVGWLVGWLVG